MSMYVSHVRNVEQECSEFSYQQAGRQKRPAHASCSPGPVNKTTVARFSQHLEACLGKYKPLSPFSTRIISLRHKNGNLVSYCRIA